MAGRFAYGAALLLLLSAAARPAAHDPITTKVTFAREIRAILSSRCASCHAAGGSAPMPLTTYEEVRPWARTIKEQVLTRRMPKWHAARGFGAFKNDPSLTPIEQTLITAWVDGGLPRGANGAEGAAGAKGAGAKGAEGGKGAKGASAVAGPSRTPAMAGRPAGAASRQTRAGGVSAIVEAGASEGVVRGRSRWVSAWSFEPGDPLITSALVTSDAGGVGTWVAGDGEIPMPPGAAIRVRGRVRVQVQRRAATDYEQPFKTKRSILRFTTREGPVRRVWSEQVSCGAARAGRAAELLAVRPLLAAGGSARLWLDRTGATKTILGWFREFDPAYARTYWLARPADLGADARLQSDAPCAVELTLVSYPQHR